MTCPAHECIAPAKLNLTLRVFARRTDGYHRIDSLVAFCRFGDVLQVRFGVARDHVAVSGRFAADVTGSNIVAAALERYREWTGWPAAAEIRIDKRIPVAAGLGGGSADAAALLRLLQRHAPAPLDGDGIMQLARALGADVPACLYGRPACMRGIGDILHPLAGPVPEWHVVLVNAGAAAPTASVFERFAGPYSAPGRDASWSRLAAMMPPGRVTRLPNDLIAAAGHVASGLSETLDSLALAPGLRGFGMSGSGATCFGLFAADDAARAERAAAAFRGRGWWSVRTGLAAGPAAHGVGEAG